VSDDNAQPNSPFTSRGFITAAIIVGVIVLAAVIVLVTTLTSPHDPIAQPTSTPSSPVASGTDKSVCGLSGFETQSSLTDAPKTKWELVGTVAAPTDPKGAGPGKVANDGLRTCFSHTAQGALFAIVNYFALSSDARTLPLIPELIEPGPGFDAAQKNAEADTPSNTRVQVAGFKVNSYTSGEAVIDVAWTVTSSGNQLISLPMVMHWVAGDWKVSLTDTGQLPFTSAPLQSLGGYTPWAGV
jgi:hypothetical protein